MAHFIYHLNGQTWLICGGRNFSDQQMFDSAMGDLLRLYGYPEIVVHGAATQRESADAMAGEWGKRMAITVLRFPAEWEKHGKAAGPIRNQRMLDETKPDLVIAFPGGRGTADMVVRATNAGVKVEEVRRSSILEPELPL